MPVFPRARLDTVRVDRAAETVFVLVNEPREIGTDGAHRFLGLPEAQSYPYPFIIRRVRLDVVIDDFDDGRRAFRHVLMHTTVRIDAGTRQYGPYTPRALDGSHWSSTDDVSKVPPGPVQYAYLEAIEVRDISIAPRADFRVTLDYDGPKIPVGFMRVVLIGTTRGDD